MKNFKTLTKQKRKKSLIEYKMIRFHEKVIEIYNNIKFIGIHRIFKSFIDLIKLWKKYFPIKNFLAILYHTVLRQYIPNNGQPKMILSHPKTEKISRSDAALFIE